MKFNIIYEKFNENFYSKPPKKNIFAILDSMIESGRSYSKEHSSLSPLMYAYHGTQYIGKYSLLLHSL